MDDQAEKYLLRSFVRFENKNKAKNAANLYSLKKENAVWLPSLRTLRQNNLAETSSFFFTARSAQDIE